MKMDYTQKQELSGTKYTQKWHGYSIYFMTVETVRSERALRSAETLVESGYEAAQHLKNSTKT